MTKSSTEPREYHPFAKLFPMLPEEELQALAENIRQCGQLYPIIVDADDRVVEGRNRLVACRLAGVDPAIEARDLDDRDALALVVSANIHRRHLTEAQRADIAAKIANLPPGGQTKSRRSADEEPEGARVRLQGGTEDEAEGAADELPPVTQAEAAKALQVSRRAVQQAAKVQKRGTPELQAAVSGGDVSLRQAEQIANLPESEQPAAVAAAQAPKPKSPRQMSPRERVEFDADAAAGRLVRLVRDELGRWPPEHLATAAHWVRALLTELRM